MNPYQILGVSENASDEEIGKAYKALARQYHPDVNSSEEAGKKMVEINCAYDEIKKMREQGVTYQSYQNVYQNGRPHQSLYAQVENALHQGYFFEAFMLLQSNPVEEGRWYYYNAVVYAEMGNLNASLRILERALQLEPQNEEFLSFRSKLIKAGENRMPKNELRVFSMWRLFMYILLLTFSIGMLARCFGG